MPRGGARRGAGRKAGLPNAKTVERRAIADKAAAEGITPIEVLLDNMRFYHHGADVALRALLDGHLPLPNEGAKDAESPVAEAVIEGFKDILRLRHMASDAADKAAPFIHARISPIDATKGQREDQEIPLVERLTRYARRDAIAASAGKVVPMLPAPDRPAPTGRAKAKAR